MANISERTLIDQLLESQRELTAVEQFARYHEENDHPAQAKYYRNLIPLSRPEAGQQYAFDVDLDRCSGCKACVTACHSLNGLAENETWRSVGALHGGTAAAPFQATVTTACHHCVDPACLNGCPVLAYEKNSVTGIVRHLDDQCIGCQYCVLMCPYEVPQYHAAKGIVRKCDMCSNRLASGEAPACVQACPSEAIRITVVDQKEIAIATSTGNQLVPGAPDSSLTIPTSKYHSSRKFPENVHPADLSTLKPAQAHPPLVWMLILTQMSAGMFLFAVMNRSFFAGLPKFETAFYFAALTPSVAGIIASVFHLGRPMQAWRSFLGWRKSWLSREILLFGAFINGAAAFTILGWAPLLFFVAVIGLIAVSSSVMVYADTGRTFWSMGRTGLRFFGSTILLGLAGSITVAAFFGKVPTGAVAALMGFTALKIAWEASGAFRPSEEPSLKRSALLQTGLLGLWMRARFICGFMGGIALPSVLQAEGAIPGVVAIAAFCFLLAGELLERHLFFIAVSPPKMPGEVAA